MTVTYIIHNNGWHKYYYLRKDYNMNDFTYTFIVKNESKVVVSSDYHTLIHELTNTDL